MSKENEKLEKALKLLEEANQKHINEDDIEGALQLYQMSIEEYPTADGYTFLGWMHSLSGRTSLSMDFCYKALQLDPDFGNPYNDLGCAFLDLDLDDIAIEWFQRAKKARRYECWHFPFQNLANCYRSKNEMTKAIVEYATGWMLAPWSEFGTFLFHQLTNIAVQ